MMFLLSASGGIWVNWLQIVSVVGRLERTFTRCVWTSSRGQLSILFIRAILIDSTPNSVTTFLKD